MYDPVTGVWVALTISQFETYLIKWIKSHYPDNYRSFKPSSGNLHEIVKLIQTNCPPFSMVEAQVNANKDGRLIGFLNGVLNTVTLVFSEHSPDFYLTNILNVPYIVNCGWFGFETYQDFLHYLQSLAAMHGVDNLSELPTSESVDAFRKLNPGVCFLFELVGFNQFKFFILCGLLYLIFSNTLTYQLAIYFYGPAGTGKSTLSNIILHIIGSKSAIQSTLKHIESRFGVISILQKALVIISELPALFRHESSILKAIIGLDLIQGEEKFGASFQFVPTSFMVIVSNMVWALRSVTGFARKFLYFKLDFIPKVKNPNLFNIKSGGLVEGELVNFLPTLVSTILLHFWEFLR